MWKVENNNPRTFRQVKFWAAMARHGFPPADASIRNLVYENTGLYLAQSVTTALMIKSSLKLNNLLNWISVGSPATHNNLIATLPTWGPSYRIAFNLYVHSFRGRNLKSGKWAELLRFSRTNNNCCAIGDRIPTIMTNKGGFIQVGTQIGNIGNKWKNVNLNVKTWYRVELLQYVWNRKVRKNEQWIYVIIILL